jgi:hypothetical protein
VRRKFAALVLFMLVATGASAHRLDEYLQGTIFSVAKNRLDADLTLTPGVAVFPMLIPDIDTDGDGAISDVEQHAYAERVLADLSLNINGHRLTAHLESAEFPAIDDMKEGRGEIHLQFYTDLPHGGAGLPRGGSGRKLVFENHHQNKISVYQVNVLVPRDPDIKIVSQKRNYSQSLYELDFDEAGVRADGPAWAFIASLGGQFTTMLLVVFAIMISIRVLRKRRADAVVGEQYGQASILRSKDRAEA